MRTQYHHCRWCGKTYRNKFWGERDGFCTLAHKQAHHRAYKKYVTGRASNQEPAGSRKVTRIKKGLLKPEIAKGTES